MIVVVLVYCCRFVVTALAIMKVLGSGEWGARWYPCGIIIGAGGGGNSFYQ